MKKPKSIKRAASRAPGKSQTKPGKRAEVKKTAPVSKTGLSAEKNSFSFQRQKRASVKKAFVDDYDLPSSYNKTQVRLIARDPYWIYAYWEVSPSAIQSARAKLGNDFDHSKHCLRMYDVSLVDFNGSNANSSFDIEVQYYNNNWYVNLSNDGVSYVADIGLRSPNGEFVTLARSNSVTTPRENSSPRNDLMWMDIEEDANKAPYIYVREESDEYKMYGSGARYLRHKYSLTEDDVRIYYSKLFPLLRHILAARLAKGLGTKGKLIYIEDQELLDTHIMKGMTRRQFIKRLRVGSSEELTVIKEKTAKEVMDQGASESIFSGASVQVKGDKKFFFELGTELIVYGRTEPDAEVWYGDKRIELREDGTFSLRFALPDGEIPLDFKAISKDKKQKRRITTSVARTKTIKDDKS
ncbi:DUF4912 domain-containing protein [Candidatus Omnitrophota bacterium]